MNILLDTHLLIWSGFDLPQLPPRARAMIEQPDNDLLFSSASIWEMAIKRSYGREDFQVDIPRLRTGLLDNGYTELPVTSDHAQFVADLPLHHRDPFDRLLVAQAAVEKIKLLTADRQLRAYGDYVLLV